MELVSKVLVSLIALGFCSLFFYFYSILWLGPEKKREVLKRQGIRGPQPSSFLFGNIREIKRMQLEARKVQQNRGEGEKFVVHNYFQTLYPHISQWKKEYGETFFFSAGSTVTLYAGSYDLAKQICSCASLDLGKPIVLKKANAPLFGEGIVFASGSLWSHQRKTIAPELFMDKVKGMVELMVDSAIPLLRSWEERVKQEGGVADIKVDEDLKSFSADVLARACFGSSFSKGEEIFSRIRALQKGLSAQAAFVGIPGLRYLPIKGNREAWRLAREIRSLILKIVKERRKNTEVEMDLLQSILQNFGNPNSADNFIVDNCKSLYFAGSETIATAAKWVLVLLASHLEWQDCVRAEATKILDGRMPDSDMLHNLPLLTMVIRESLRLYPAAVGLNRQAHKDMKFENFKVPKGTVIWFPTLEFLYDAKLWGPDVNEFKPERFTRGISHACESPQLYTPFGMGLRTCLGQNLAHVELKVILSLILSRFKISISPKFRHSVVQRIALEPEYGVNLLVGAV